MARAGRFHFDRVQRVVWRVLGGGGGGIFFGCLGAAVADGAGGILRGSLYRVSLWTMRRARSVADAASAGTFDRSSFALRIGGGGAASGGEWWRVARLWIFGSHPRHW